ncbi:hypothetical protein HMPREF9406_0993 [Clostridium sp. HGF2]|nr:hypothetical protein HMPREF9406_0993 [Clostridium sp. HGF2]EQJ60666.1 putative membrane protein [Clostridioides difficile P28]
MQQYLFNTVFFSLIQAGISSVFSLLFKVLTLSYTYRQYHITYL